MATLKTSRSRSAAATAKENGPKLEEGLNPFKSEKFDAESYVQSNCSLNDKEIKQLCAYLVDLKKVSAEEMRRSVYANYAAFIRTSKEISDLEGELSSIRNLLSTQAALIHGLAEGVHIDSSSISNSDGLSVNGTLDSEDKEISDLDKWLVEFPDLLDVLLAERRVEEALAALDEGERVVSEAKELKSINPSLLLSLQSSISERRQKLADQLAEAACQPSTRGAELRASVSALKKLGDGPHAHSLLLNVHQQRYQYNMQSLRPSSTSYGGAYTAALAQLVFSAVAQAASDSLAIFGEEPAYTSELVMWASKQTEAFALLVKRHALSSSAAAGGLRAAAECVQIALGHCSLLEARGLALCPVLLKLFRPSVEQALDANLKRIQESTAALAAADDWVLTYPPTANRQTSRPSSISITNTTAFQHKLTSSAHRFNLMVQDFFEDVGPLLSMQLGGQALEGLFQVFNSYINMLIKALPGSMEEEASFEDSGNKIVRMAETEAQQIALLANASLLADELLPRAAMKLSPIGKQTFLEGLVTSLPTLRDGQSAFDLHFEWDSDMGIPGAFYIENFMQVEFFLVSLTIEDVPNQGTIHFDCNSWVYNAKLYNTTRIFFANKTYLPSETPGPLVKYREEELKTLRGDGTGERKEYERIYDYDVYNDLGDPDSNARLARPVLGGSTLPYPRRGRTGRKPAKTDPKSESRSDTVYLPRDEAFGHLKSSDFLVYILKSAAQNVIPQLQSALRLQFNNPEFTSFDDVRGLYDGGIKLPTDILSNISPIPLFTELFRTDGEQALKFPPPKVIQVNQSGWMTDEEFAREMIAGVNPHIIKRLTEFPPKSKLDSQLYGDNTSKITRENLEPNLGGLTVEQAIQNNRLFILDHHDPLIPYLRRINATDTKAYATRTILFLQDNGTLKPLAIELSKPHPQGDNFGPISDVYLPADQGVDASIWLLAKAYVVVNDSCYHQLVSHWLNTHAVVEPFVIATNRQLSAVHPIHKLLRPHYRDTMNINALARNVLVNAEGIIESTFLWGNYALEMSAVVYKDWVFPEQALPADLLKRGVAVEDSSSPHGLRLLIEDYPYAADGLEIWDAIKSWVQEYVFFYYKSDAAIVQDTELQAFWKELVQVGHGDKKNETWWVKMQTREELIESCTTLIWTASALHAAVNFGQYPYGGLILNRPTLSRQFMPELGSPEYDELSKNSQKVFLKTITGKSDALKDLTIIEVLSRHASDELYLGERDSEFWTSDSQPIEAFKRFGKKLADIEQKLVQRNNDERLRNRYGPVQMPYTLLYPSSEEGLTCRGIPNSISI